MAITPEEKRRAEEAALILRSAVFADAFEQLREKYFRRWLAGQTVEQRERAWHLQAALGEVREDLLAIVQGAVLDSKGRDEDLNRLLKDAKDAPKAKKKKG